jgi:prophage tail gpP-like protein
VDTVYLLIDGKLIERFVSYDIDADLYCVPSAFQVELAEPEVRISNGMAVELYVNDILELTGTIDRRNPTYDKSGRKNVICGRDLMGWPVDAYCTSFGTLQEKKLSELAETLLADMPYVDLKRICYQEDITGNLKTKKTSVGLFDSATALSQIEPGTTVFEVLKEYSRSRGLIFFCEPGGRFVFGKPAEGGEAKFSIVHRKDGKGNNVEAGGLDEDYSKRFSQVMIIGQKQGSALFSSATDLNVSTTVEDETGDLPDNFYKPFVQKDETGGDRQDLQARMALEKMRHEGFRLQYTVTGHSQNGKNWTINELASVVDEDPDIDINDTFLITGRTFHKSKDAGTVTKLRLGYKGSVA